MAFSSLIFLVYRLPLQTVISYQSSNDLLRKELSEVKVPEIAFPHTYFLIPLKHGVETFYGKFNELRLHQFRIAQYESSKK